MGMEGIRKEERREGKPSVCLDPTCETRPINRRDTVKGTDILSYWGGRAPTTLLIYPTHVVGRGHKRSKRPSTTSGVNPPD